MFDKLIESDSVQAEFKPRRKFFMVSSVIVGIAFLSAVVVSLYAQEIDLGTDNFELAELIAPIAPDAPEPDPPHEQPQQTQSDRMRTNVLPNLPELIAQLDKNTKPPDGISTVNNAVPEIPDSGKYENMPTLPVNHGSGNTGPVNPGGDASNVEPTPAEVVKTVEPPPPPPPTVKKSRTISGGVVSGMATYLPKPPYSPAIRSLNITGDVQVQVLIDETGSVVSAHAVNGHVLLRQEAERAARKAKFRPTTLSGDPVKVTGIIVYKFAR